MSNKKVFILLICIVFFGTFLRFYRLGENSFVADEFLDINATYGYHQTGQWQAWDFNLNKPAERINKASDERAWSYRWQVAKLFDYFPPTEFFARSVSVFWGILTIIIIYFAASYFSSKKEIGLISSFLFSISISGIEFDRTLRMYAMFFPIFLLFSWAVFALYESKYKCKISIINKISEKFGINFPLLVPVLLLGILSLKTHELTVNIVFVLGIYVLIKAIMIFKSKKEYLNKYALTFDSAVALFIFLWLIFPEKIKHYTEALEFFNNNHSYIGKALADYSHPLLAILLIGVGVWYLIKKEKRINEGLWLVVSFVGILLAAIFLWKRNAGPQYIFFIQSFAIILIASGIFGSASFLKDNLKYFGKKAFWIPMVVLLLLVPNYGYFFQENNTYYQNSKSDNPNYRSIFGYFKKYKNKNDVLITRDFRNYYFSGEKVKVYDFGGELSREKFSLEDLQNILVKNKSGWFIFSDNDKDYISKSVDEYIEKNMEKINAIAVRGDISVYRWGNEDIKFE